MNSLVVYMAKMANADISPKPPPSEDWVGLTFTDNFYTSI